MLHGGRVVITSAKHHLPKYGVFAEYRYFVPGNTLPVFRLPVGEEAVEHTRIFEARAQLPDQRLRGLLYQLRDDPRVRAFADRELGALVSYDAVHGTRLVGDLAAFHKDGHIKG